MYMKWKASNFIDKDDKISSIWIYAHKPKNIYIQTYVK